MNEDLKMKTELEILKDVKFMFELHSDNSTQCNGYRSLCRKIEELETKVANENFSLLIDIKVCSKCNGVGKIHRGFGDIKRCKECKGHGYIA